jgi:Tfp pilus assembly ATPase PilU
MSQPIEGEHTLKGVTENQYLPPLQKQILLYLAETPPKSKYGVKIGIKGHYKSVYDAIDDLIEKKILVEIKKEEYRSQEHSVYWLTSGAVFVALVYGANAKTVLNRTIEIYPDNQMLQCFIELTTCLGTDIYQIGYQAILKKGKLEKSDVSLMLGTGLMKDLSLVAVSEVISLMKKYPEQFSGFKEQMVEIMEKMKKTELFLKDALEKS